MEHNKNLNRRDNNVHVCMQICGNVDGPSAETYRVYKAAVKAAIEAGKDWERYSAMYITYGRSMTPEELCQKAIKDSLLAETGKNESTFEVPAPFDMPHLVGRILKEAIARSIVLKRL